MLQDLKEGDLMVERDTHGVNWMARSFHLRCCAMFETFEDRSACRGPSTASPSSAAMYSVAGATYDCRVSLYSVH
jgi:hypothetical protein